MYVIQLRLRIEEECTKENVHSTMDVLKGVFKVPVEFEVFNNGYELVSAGFFKNEKSE